MSNPAKSRNVGLLHVGDQLFLAAALLPGTDHDGRAVRVVGTDVDASMPAQLLKPDPDVGLDVLDQMADMDVPVGVGQGGGDQNPAWAGGESSILFAFLPRFF